MFLYLKSIFIAYHWGPVAIHSAQSPHRYATGDTEKLDGTWVNHLTSDVKRGQKLEAEARVPRPRPRPGL